MVLRVKLEIVPCGVEENAREIGRLDIFNKGPTEFGHHEYGVINLSPRDAGLYDKEIFHRRNNGAWELVRKVLTSLKIDGP